MERLERLTVHVEAGFAALEQGADAQFRLALLLFDSAAELLMHRRTEWELSHERWKINQLASLDAMAAQHPDLPPSMAVMREELRAEALSQRKLKEIERNFDAKAEYLATRQHLEPGLVRVLKKLHQYRNEVYHRDQVREATLRTSAELYALVIAGLMEKLTPSWVGHGAEMPAALVKYLGAEQYLGFEAQAEVARQLMAASGLGTWESIPSLLSEHAESRIDGLLEDLEFSLSLLRDEWDAEAVLHMVQIEPPERFRIGAQAARDRAVPVTMEKLDTWRDEVASFRSLTDPLVGFSAFADFEDDFEPIENEVNAFARAVDDEIQLQIDIARGK